MGSYGYPIELCRLPTLSLLTLKCETRGPNFWRRSLRTLYARTFDLKRPNSTWQAM